MPHVGLGHRSVPHVARELHEDAAAEEAAVPVATHLRSPRPGPPPRHVDLVIRLDRVPDIVTSICE